MILVPERSLVPEYRADATPGHRVEVRPGHWAEIRPAEARPVASGKKSKLK